MKNTTAPIPIFATPPSLAPIIAFKGALARSAIVITPVAIMVFATVVKNLLNSNPCRCFASRDICRRTIIIKPVENPIVNHLIPYFGATKYVIAAIMLIPVTLIIIGVIVFLRA